MVSFLKSLKTKKSSPSTEFSTQANTAQQTAPHSENEHGQYPEDQKAPKSPSKQDSPRKQDKPAAPQQVLDPDKIMRIDTLCRSLCGNPVYCLTITNDLQETYLSSKEECEQYRKFEYDNGGQYRAVVTRDKKGKKRKKDKMNIQVNGSNAFDNNGPANTSTFIGGAGIQIPQSAQHGSSIVVNVVQQQNPVQKRKKCKKGHAGIGLIQQNSMPQDSFIINQGLLNQDSLNISLINQIKPGNQHGLTTQQSRRGPGAADQSQIICESQEGNNISYSFARPQSREKPKKKFIVITSRVHPGESNSSYLVHGVIKFLLSESSEANELREKFIFKVIPMLNPDGVIYGNYRSSILGVDLNRRWKNPSKYLHPTIYYTKSYIKYLMCQGGSTPNVASLPTKNACGNVVLTCDFHGHSRKNNVFMYGCVSLSQQDGINLVQNQIMHLVPEFVSYVCPIFNNRDCRFALEREKETTARIVLFRELGILNSYTLETTFYKSDLIGPNAKKAVDNKKQLSNVQAKEAAQAVLASMKPTDGGSSINPIAAALASVNGLPPQNFQPQISPVWADLEQRPDQQITALDLIEVGQDFLRGIHQCLQHRAIYKYWFYERYAEEQQQILMQQQQLQVQQSLMMKEMKEMKEKRQSNQKVPLINKLAPRKDTSPFDNVTRLALAGSSSKRSQQNSFISTSNKSNVNLQRNLKGAAPAQGNLIVYQNMDPTALLGGRHLSLPMDEIQGEEVERRIIGNFDVVSRTLNNAIEHRSPVKGLTNPSQSNANGHHTRSQRRLMRHDPSHQYRDSSSFPGVINIEQKRQGQVSRINNQEMSAYEEDQYFYGDEEEVATFNIVNELQRYEQEIGDLRSTTPEISSNVQNINMVHTQNVLLTGTQKQQKLKAQIQQRNMLNTSNITAQQTQLPPATNQKQPQQFIVNHKLRHQQMQQQKQYNEFKNSLLQQVEIVTAGNAQKNNNIIKNITSHKIKDPSTIMYVSMYDGKAAQQYGAYQIQNSGEKYVMNEDPNKNNCQSNRSSILPKNQQKGTKLVGLPPNGVSSDDFLNTQIGMVVPPKLVRKVISNHSSNGGNKSGSNMTQVPTRSSNMALTQYAQRDLDGEQTPLSEQISPSIQLTKSRDGTKKHVQTSSSHQNELPTASKSRLKKSQALSKGIDHQHQYEQIRLPMINDTRQNNIQDNEQNEENTTDSPERKVFGEEKIQNSILYQSLNTKFNKKSKQSLEEPDFIQALSQAQQKWTPQKLVKQKNHGYIALSKYESDGYHHQITLEDTGSTPFHFQPIEKHQIVGLPHQAAASSIFGPSQHMIHSLHPMIQKTLPKYGANVNGQTVIKRGSNVKEYSLSGAGPVQSLYQQMNQSGPNIPQFKSPVGFAASNPNGFKLGVVAPQSNFASAPAQHTETDSPSKKSILMPLDGGGVGGQGLNSMSATKLDRVKQHNDRKHQQQNSNVISNNNGGISVINEGKSNSMPQEHQMVDNNKYLVTEEQLFQQFFILEQQKQNQLNQSRTLNQAGQPPQALSQQNQIKSQYNQQANSDLKKVKTQGMTQGKANTNGNFFNYQHQQYTPIKQHSGLGKVQQQPTQGSLNADLIFPPAICFADQNFINKRNPGVTLVGPSQTAINGTMLHQLQNQRRSVGITQQNTQSDNSKQPTNLPVSGLNLLNQPQNNTFTNAVQEHLAVQQRREKDTTTA